jgi:ribosomal protein S18 acetylase RimI-like enzyme
VSVPRIRAARADEIPAVGALVARSFDHLDQCGYLVPPPSDRERVLTGFFTLYTGHAHRYGRVDVVDRGDGIEGAAVWFDRTAGLPEPAQYEHRLAGLAGSYLDRFQALDALFDKYHPGEPHWHLAFLAVHPDHRNRGLGGALMRRTEAELDPAGVPQYLEATNAGNVRLYRRHGYREMDPYDILLPDGTPFYRMWRPAGG